MLLEHTLLVLDASGLLQRAYIKSRYSTLKTFAKFKVRLAMVGIYKISNTISGKFYIGSSFKMAKRKCNHFSSLRNNRHGNRHLQNAWNKYGEDTFIWEVLEETTKEVLIQREQFYIDTLKPEYNIRQVAENNSGCKLSEVRKYDYKHTEKTKKQISDKTKGVKKSEETKINMSKAQKGRIVTEQHRRNMSKAASSRTKQGNCKSITIDGVTYNTHKEAMATLGLTKYAIQKLLIKV
jgi:group I intron endonuclease